MGAQLKMTIIGWYVPLTQDHVTPRLSKLSKLMKVHSSMLSNASGGFLSEAAITADQKTKRATGEPRDETTMAVLRLEGPSPSRSPENRSVLVRPRSKLGPSNLLNQSEDPTSRLGVSLARKRSPQ
jgi:hypothetical protein